MFASDECKDTSSAAIRDVGSATFTAGGRSSWRGATQAERLLVGCFLAREKARDRVLLCRP